MNSATNLAYNLSRYETGRLEQEHEQHRKPAIRVKTNTQAHAGGAKAVTLVVTAGLLMGGVIYSKVQSASLYSEVARTQNQVDLLHSENLRMKSEIDSKTSMQNVEAYAENVLGLQKIDKSQVEYIKLETDNSIEIPEQDENMFISIRNSFNEFVEYIKG